MKESIRIGELARMTGYSVETIRFYEKERLIPHPRRGTNNYRQYGERHVEDLCLIRRCRSLNMPLNEIKRLLQLREMPRENCAAVCALLDEHIGHVRTRVAELEQLQTQLDSLRQCCSGNQTAEQCGILSKLRSG
jgi:Cd(II)/Pb(II)-responsive transcriptional regulator